MTFLLMFECTKDGRAGAGLSGPKSWLHCSQEKLGWRIMLLRRTIFQTATMSGTKSCLDVAVPLYMLPETSIIGGICQILTHGPSLRNCTKSSNAGYSPSS